jgi:hypothetical protein
MDKECSTKVIIRLSFGKYTRAYTVEEIYVFLEGYY